MRIHQNPVADEPEIPDAAPEPRLPAIQRSDVPRPPLFYEDLLVAGLQLGATIQAQQSQFLAQGGGLIGLAPPAPNQPQGEPDPELPGAGEPPSEQETTEPTAVESDTETLQFNEERDGHDYPETTDTDPYEEAENPESSQAEAEPAPDIDHIDIADSSYEEEEAEVITDQSPQKDETPKATAAGESQEPIMIEEEEEQNQVSQLPQRARVVHLLDQLETGLN